MQPALLVRLQPIGAWRYGPGDGACDRVDTVFRSDRLYSAITLAMEQLGHLEDWLEATARDSDPAITFSSLFPYLGDTLFAVPPYTLWPPPPSLVSSQSPVLLTKIRWKAARFVPLTVIESLITNQAILAEQWIPDPESGCLLKRDRPTSSPFRFAKRGGVAVDRITNRVAPLETLACVEFERGSGLWTVIRYRHAAARSEWGERIKAVFRLLADSGFGGRRTIGWGKAEPVSFQEGDWPGLLFPTIERLSTSGGRSSTPNGEASLYWLLSVYSPSPADRIDWGGGDYKLTVRGGRIESRFGSGVEKKSARLVSEGSVLAAQAEPIGAAVDVAPNGFAHPVYRSGAAVAVRLPSLETLAQQGPVEIPSGEELEQRPCAEGPRSRLGESEPTTEESAAESSIEQESAIEEPNVEERAEEEKLSPDRGSTNGEEPET